MAMVHLPGVCERHLDRAAEALGPHQVLHLLGGIPGKRTRRATPSGLAPPQPAPSDTSPSGNQRAGRGTGPTDYRCRLPARERHSRRRLELMKNVVSKMVALPAKLQKSEDLASPKRLLSETMLHHTNNASLSLREHGCYAPRLD